ncbi:hypothetical protein Avbf_11826 [Armadillidium vulgare]|nr:hypothetical protein Avbf_11826 [Armadillidium vulgare]
MAEKYVLPIPVLLIYNTATYSDEAVDNYNQINSLADYFAGQEFEILGFPTNEFGKNIKNDVKRVINKMLFIKRRQRNSLRKIAKSDFKFSCSVPSLVTISTYHLSSLRL